MKLWAVCWELVEPSSVGDVSSFEQLVPRVTSGYQLLYIIHLMIANHRPLTSRRCTLKGLAATDAL